MEWGGDGRGWKRVEGSGGQWKRWRAMEGDGTCWKLHLLLGELVVGQSVGVAAVDGVEGGGGAGWDGRVRLDERRGLDGGPYVRSKK